MLIHELARQTGLSIHTIRFYEKSGLIRGYRDPAVTSNNYFHYNQESVEKLLLIRDAKSIGFTLSEIGELLEAWYNDRFSVAEKQTILDRKIRAIDDKIDQLRAMKTLVEEFKHSVSNNAC